jgi:nucleotide-binding universal stress UspA family protein
MQMKVLYATNGMDIAQKAGTLIRRLGNKTSINLLVLCVENIEFLLPAEGFVLGSEPKSRMQPAEILPQAEEGFRGAGFHVETRIETGAPATEILKVITREQYELTVLGAGRQSWLGSVLLGSTSTSLLHSSPTSVLLVHEVSPEQRKLRVLVGVDGSEAANRAMGTFSQFADPACCTVTVLSVAERATKPLPNLPRPRQGGLTGPTEEKAEEISRSTADKLSRQGFTARPKVTVGSPPVELLKSANDGDFDLVVVGSRGLGRVRGAVLGSVSEQITRHAKAVLVGHKQR